MAAGVISAICKSPLNPQSMGLDLLQRRQIPRWPVTPAVGSFSYRTK